MKAIVLAAGIGSRLSPITDIKPKTMVEVNGKPMLGYIIDSLIENGIPVKSYLLRKKFSETLFL